MNTVQLTPGPNSSVVLSITSVDGTYVYAVLTGEMWIKIMRDGETALKHSMELSSLTQQLGASHEPPWTHD